MAEEMDLLNTSVIRTILTETDKSEDRDRRRDSFNAYQVYSGNQYPYVQRALAQTRPKSWQSYTISNISVSKMITDKRAQSYNERPIRSVDGGEEKSELLSDIYEQAQANRELQFLDTVFNLNKYALMWVNYREQDAAYQFMTLHPYEFVLVRDKDTGELLVVGLNYPNRELTGDAYGSGPYGAGMTGGDGISDLIAEGQADGASQGETWVFWSKDQHVKVKVATTHELVNGESVYKKNIDFIPIEGNPNNVNPLGIVPFVLVSHDTAVDYPTKSPLTEQSITFNVQQSETLTAKNIHGSGIQVFKYPEKLAGRFSKMEQGQTVAVELPQSSDPDDKATEFEYKTSGAQLSPMLENDMNYLQQIFNEHGIENASMEGGKIDMSSGISKAISSSSVQRIIEKNQQLYSSLEKDMFEVIRAWDVFNGTNMFSGEDDLQIVYPKPKVMVSDKQTLDNIKLMLELGVIEEWEKFIKMDPNLTEEEAKEKLERIESDKMEKAMNFFGDDLDANKQEPINEKSEAGPNGSNFGRKA